MAKKKAKKKVKAKAQAKKSAAVKVETQPKPPKKPVKKKKTFLIPLITLAVLLLVAGEIYFVIQKEMKLNKKPVFTGKWDAEYKGQIGIPVYGSHLYVIDNDLNQIKKYEKLTGKLVDVFEVDKNPLWAIATSKGETYVPVTDSNVLRKFTSGPKQKGKLVLEGAGGIAGITIDSKDNIYIAEHGTNKIKKYNTEGEKILEFAGRGSGGSRIEKIGRIFTGPDDKVYALDYRDKLNIKIYDDEGRFINKFAFDLSEKTGMENIVIMQDGNMYVNDTRGSKILVFNPRGKMISRFEYDADGRFKIAFPGSISGGYDNRLYVASHAIGIFEAIQY